MATAVTPVPLDEQPGHPPLLEVRDAAVHFGPVRALDGVHLTVQPGEVVALAGENGAGKSTLIRCIAGDIAPTAGQVLIGGQRVTADPGLVARRGVTVVWQDLALCENLDVASNLLLGEEGGRLLMSETRFHAKAGALLAGLGIPLADTTQSVRTLSGGQRQLLAVARALRHRPRLLILDEPTASLGVVEAEQVEALVEGLRRQGTTILIACHDIDQMYRLADRVVVLRHGRVVADVDPSVTHPDDVVSFLSGQQVDSSARRQLSRLHGLVDQLTSADPSSSLALILSALGGALRTTRLCIHLAEDGVLRAAAVQGLPAELVEAWGELPYGPAGGPVGQVAASEAPVLDGDVTASTAWTGHRWLAERAGIRSSWAVPVMGSAGLTGVITVFPAEAGRPERDELDLVTLYAGYAAAAIERERLLGEVTARNRVLETIRELLQTLAGPVPLGKGLAMALDALREGLQADEVALVGAAGTDPHHEPAVLGWAGGRAGGPSPSLATTAAEMLARPRHDGTAVQLPAGGGGWHLAVTFLAPGGPTVLLAGWATRAAPPDDAALMEDAAHSLRLALERAESERAHQETAALRRSQQLQRGFLSRLSHELRTPLTAIRGYASSLMQPDVTWDGDSQRRFLSRMAAESARLGRLVDDLLDFSAIESGVLRLQRDWCELGLVLDAAAACLPPSADGRVELSYPADLPVVWADHDRLEQVFLNLMDNAVRHNPRGTRVWVDAGLGSPGEVVVTVRDDGQGVPDDLVHAPAEARTLRRSPTAGAGLGLSICRGIVTAHGGRLELEHGQPGTLFRVHLPVEAADPPGEASGG